MNFFLIKDLTNGTFENQPISINLMCSILEKLSDSDEFKTLESIFPNQIIIFKKTDILPNADLPFISSIKDHTFALVPNNTVFSVKNDTEYFHAKLYNGNLVIHNLLEELEKLTPTIDLSYLSNDEKKAYMWLDSGNVGLSSKQMCHTIYPNLNHHELVNIKEDNIDGFEPSYPRDLSDFNRCLGFLNDVPEAREHLSKVANLSEKWEKIINNWTDIENLINEDKKEEAASILNQILDRTNKLKI